jgi:hypothetical protein
MRRNYRIPPIHDHGHDKGTHEALVKPLDKSGYEEYLRRVLTDRLLP